MYDLFSTGFAVVADEVRNLAIRAAEAAKNTNQLIESTINEVKTGTELTQQTQTAFADNTKKSAMIAELITEIAAASNEQANGISQIGNAIADMDKVTQQNAAHAEQTAAASGLLHDQANQVQAFVNDLLAMIGRQTVDQPASAQTALPAPKMALPQLDQPRASR